MICPLKYFAKKKAKSSLVTSVTFLDAGTLLMG
jgi:hypothetical protein